MFYQEELPSEFMSVETCKKCLRKDNIKHIQRHLIYWYEKKWLEKEMRRIKKWKLKK